MVNPGDDEDMIRARNAQSDASQSVNMYANRLWYVVFYFSLQLCIMPDNDQVLPHMLLL